MKFLRLFKPKKKQLNFNPEEDNSSASSSSSGSGGIRGSYDQQSGSSSSSSRSCSSSRCDDSAKLNCLASFPGCQAGAMALTVIKDQQYLYASSSQEPRINVVDCGGSSSKFSVIGSIGFKSPPARIILVTETKVYTAHHDMKIRVWSKTTTAGHNQELVLKHKLLATLPSFRDIISSSSSRLLRSSLLPSNNPKQSHRLPRRRRRPQPPESTELHSDAISALAIGLSESILYSASWDKTIKVWSIGGSRSIKCVESFVAHDDAVNALAVANDRSSSSSSDSSTVVIYSASANGEIKVWEGSFRRRQNRGRITSKISHCLIASIRQHKSAVNALLLNHDSTLLYSGSGDKTIRVWSTRRSVDKQDVSLLEVLRGHRAAVLCLAATSDGEFLCSGAADKTIRIWREHRCVAALELHSSPVKWIAIASGREESSSHTVYSSAIDGEFKVCALTY